MMILSRLQYSELEYGYVHDKQKEEIDGNKLFFLGHCSSQKLQSKPCFPIFILSNVVIYVIDILTSNIELPIKSYWFA